MDSSDLNEFIHEHRIEADIVYLAVDTPTVAAAAAALGVRPEQIIKSVLFLADKQPVLVIASGTTRVDRKALADYLGVSRRRVKIASAEQVLWHTGYPAGAVPPFAHLQPIRTILETAVLRGEHETVYGGGGEIHALMRLTVTALQTVVGSEAVSLAEGQANA